MLVFWSWWLLKACAVCQIINFPSRPINKSYIWLWTWGMHQPVDTICPACWVRVSLMTWCPLLPLLFPPFPIWKICTTATNTGHGGLWCSLGRQHPGLSERAGGAFWAADPSPWGGASQRHAAVRAGQPASQHPYQPTASMAAGGDAGKWCQHVCILALPCVCLPVYLSQATLSLLPPFIWASSYHHHVCSRSLLFIIGGTQ